MKKIKFASILVLTGIIFVSCASNKITPQERQAQLDAEKTEAVASPTPENAK